MATDDERRLGALRLGYFTPVREYPPLADRKASALVAAYGLMVTVLLFFGGPIEAIIEGPDPIEAYATAAVLAALATLILVGAWNAFRALTRPIPPMPTSLAFYPHIAALPLDAYRAAVCGLDHDRALRAILHYNYSLATLSVAKFRLVERSIRCARGTFALWMLLLILITLLGP
jgi:hypothetical protein